MDRLKFYIDGAWVDPMRASTIGVINPATEEAIGRISLGSSADVDRAAAAARRTFATYSETSVEQRLFWMGGIIDGFRARLPELARTMTLEMGSPITFATERQATVALFHFEEAARVLADFAFEERMGSGIVRHEPIGVLRADHALELAAQPGRFQGCASHCNRLHSGVEAQRDCAAQRHDPGRDHS